MDIPGVKAKDIDIQVNGPMMTVTAQREEEREEKGRTFHRVERQCGCYSRTLTLPCQVNESEVAAEYHDGVPLDHAPQDRRVEGPQDQSQGLSRAVTFLTRQQDRQDLQDVSSRSRRSYRTSSERTSSDPVDPFQSCHPVKKSYASRLRYAKTISACTTTSSPSRR